MAYMKIQDLDRVVVLTLNRTPERINRFKRDWDRLDLGVDLEIFTGVDCNDVILPDWWMAAPGIYGNYLSHKQIWLESIKAKNKNIWIMEDDCAFCEDFKRKLVTCLAALPDNWDMFYLVSCFDNRFGSSEIVKINQHISQVDSTHLFMSFMMRGEILPLMLSGLESIERIVNIPAGRRGQYCYGDWIVPHVARENKMNVYLSNPYLCYEARGRRTVLGHDNPDIYYSYSIYSNIKHLNDNIHILDGRVGYDTLRFDKRDIDGKVIQPPVSGSCILAHAPSRLVVSVDKPCKVYAFQLAGRASGAPMRAYVDKQLIGEFRVPREKTSMFQLQPGHYVLSIACDNCSCAHSTWCFVEN